MPDGPVQLMFSVQDLTHHDSPDNIIACPAQGKTGRCFSRGKGFPSGLAHRFHSAQLLFVAGVIAFGCDRSQAACKDRVVMIRFIQGGSQGDQPFRSSLLRRSRSRILPARFLHRRLCGFFLLCRFLRDGNRNPDKDPEEQEQKEGGSISISFSSDTVNYFLPRVSGSCCCGVLALAMDSRISVSAMVFFIW